MEQQQQQQHQLLHFSDSNHPLLFNPDDRSGRYCFGCNEPVYGPSYSCPSLECYSYYTHHKSCAELPLGLHHPLHPIHPLILFDEKTYYPEEEEEYRRKTKCELCKEYRSQYTYRCSRCDFNLHFSCASLVAPTSIEPEFHHYPLTPFLKWITFTCDICGKKDEGMPYLCHLCDFLIHGRCSISLAKSKLCVTTTFSTSPILLLNFINLTLDFVKFVFKMWTLWALLLL